MIDIWTLFVEYTFGTFWLSVLGLMVIMMIILAIGSVSGLSILWFLLLFLLAMAYGYGYPIILVLSNIVAIYYMISQINGWREHSGGQ